MGCVNFCGSGGLKPAFTISRIISCRFTAGAENALPVTEKLYEELLTLPLHPGLTDAEIDATIAAVREFLSKASNC